MPRKKVLSESEKLLLINIPTELSELSKYYFLSEFDTALINQKRGNQNKLGFALLLCFMRHPGIYLDKKTVIPIETFQFIRDQLGVIYGKARKFSKHSTSLMLTGL